jgi:hypothetical protein
MVINRSNRHLPPECRLNCSFHDICSEEQLKKCPMQVRASLFLPLFYSFAVHCVLFIAVLTIPVYGTPYKKLSGEYVVFLADEPGVSFPESDADHGRDNIQPMKARGTSPVRNKNLTAQKERRSLEMPKPMKKPVHKIKPPTAEKAREPITASVAKDIPLAKAAPLPSLPQTSDSEKDQTSPGVQETKLKVASKENADSPGESGRSVDESSTDNLSQAEEPLQPSLSDNSDARKHQPSPVLRQLRIKRAQKMLAYKEFRTDDFARDLTKPEAKAVMQKDKAIDTEEKLVEKKISKKEPEYAAPPELPTETPDSANTAVEETLKVIPAPGKQTPVDVAALSKAEPIIQQELKTEEIRSDIPEKPQVIEVQDDPEPSRERGIVIMKGKEIEEIPIETPPVIDPAIPEDHPEYNRKQLGEPPDEKTLESDQSIVILKGSETESVFFDPYEGTIPAGPDIDRFYVAEIHPSDETDFMKDLESIEVLAAEVSPLQKLTEEPETALPDSTDKSMGLHDIHSEFTSVKTDFMKDLENIEGLVSDASSIDEHTEIAIATPLHPYKS